MSDKHVKERIQEIREVLGRGHGKFPDVAVSRRAVFVLPLEDSEHLSRVLQVGGLREREALGLSWSEEAYDEAVGLLGWFSEDEDRAALVRELDRLRSLLRAAGREAKSAVKYAQAVESGQEVWEVRA